MTKEYYGIYCKGVLGVKTNINNFRWIYGTAPLTTDDEEYKKCIVKFKIVITPEKKLKNIKSYDKKFQAYTWHEEQKTLCCRRTVFGLKIGFDIRFEKNTIFAEIGKNYYRFIKYKIMNLHGVYYLLAELANILLLNAGYLTLYASAVTEESENRGIVNFAPPNTGKTVTAIKFCKEFGYSLVGEDVVITDGEYIYGCPYTNSYRKHKRNPDSAGSLFRGTKTIKQKTCDVCKVTELTILSSGIPKIHSNKTEILRQIKLLNGYLFNYYSSPIVKILGYFDKSYCLLWEEREEEILKDMVESCNCFYIQAENAEDFYRIISSRIQNEE